MENITTYPLNADGNLAPTKILGDSATTITFPAGLAVDFEGRIYLADEGPDGGWLGSILVFGAGTAGNVASLSVIRPATTVLQTPVGITVPSNGDIWVANFGGASVMKFAGGIERRCTAGIEREIRREIDHRTGTRNGHLGATPFFFE